MFRRVVIKLSGEALAGRNITKFYDDNIILGIVLQIKQLVKRGVGVALVVGGGNIWRGRDNNANIDKVRTDQIGMMATVMNALYLADSFERAGVNAKVMTPVIVGTVTEQFSKRSALEHMNKGGVVIFAAGTGHPFFSTDTIAAIRTAELEACALLFAKNVDGVYTADPKKDGNAKKLNRITYRQVIENNMTVIDTAASAICEQQGILSIIFGLDEHGAILKCATGDNEVIYQIGTRVEA